MRIKNGYKIRIVAGESIVVSIGSLNVNLTKIISLNPTAVWLWEYIGSNDFDADKVADLLVENYEIEHSTALHDAKAWIESLRKAELIEE